MYFINGKHDAAIFPGIWYLYYPYIFYTVIGGFSESHEPFYIWYVSRSQSNNRSALHVQQFSLNFFIFRNVGFLTPGF